MLVVFASHEIKLWGGLVFLLVLALGYLGFRLTKGYIAGYLKAEIADSLKSILITVHGLGSLILALVLPNNFLVGIDFVRELYDQSPLWIAASILTLLFAGLVIFGSIFTLLTTRNGLAGNKKNDSLKANAYRYVNNQGSGTDRDAEGK